MTTNAPGLAAQVLRVGNSPNDFNKRERRLLQSVKTYVDAATGAQNALSELTDTSIVTPASGNLLIYDGTDSWDNKAMSGDATIASTGAMTIAANAITTTKIADANVTLAKLSAGATYAFVAKFAGTFTTLGGDATEVITVTGATGTDVVSVLVKTAGATPRTVTAAAAGTNNITVTLSGDPSTDHVLQYVVYRAAT